MGLKTSTLSRAKAELLQLFSSQLAVGWKHLWSLLLLCKNERETLKSKKNGPKMVTETTRDLALAQELPSVSHGVLAPSLG